MKTGVAMVILSAALCIIGSALFAGKPSKDDQQSRNVIGMSLLKAFDRGAQIYLVTEGEREPFPESSSRNLLRGIITMRVDSTLRGPAVESVRLPYCYVYTGSLHPVWQNLVWTKPGTLHTCVVIPQGWDPGVVYAEETQAVAAFVWSHRTPEAATVRAAQMRKLIAIYDGEKDVDSIRRIEEAVADADPVVCGFALQYAVLNARHLSPDVVMGMLTREVQNPRHCPNSALLVELADAAALRLLYISEKEGSKNTSLRCLAVLTQCPNEKVREASLNALGSAIHRYSASSKVADLGSLSSAEEEALRKTLEANASYPLSDEMGKWLDRPKTP